MAIRTRILQFPDLHKMRRDFDITARVRKSYPDVRIAAIQPRKERIERVRYGRTGVVR